MNLAAVAKLLGRLTLLVGLTQLLPMAWCLWFGELEALKAFGLSMGFSVVLGTALALLPSPDTTLYRREGILIVVAGWVLASVLGSLPYLFSGLFASPVDALFESASGFTTTGASVLANIEAAGYGILFWRSLTQWLGGIGIVVVFLALLSGFGPNARVLYRFEVPGPSAEVLHPRVQDTAFALVKLYVGLTFAQTLILMVVGLSLYDALIHSLSTLSTGGFSPHSESIAFFAPMAQVVIIVFMVLAGINFSLMFGIRLGRWQLWRDREFLVYAFLLVSVTAIVAVHLVLSQGDPVRSVREAAFQVTSLLTSTGFATADFDAWPAGVKALLLLLMLIGGCAGSTAGGVKVMRIFLAFKTVLREVKLSFKPNAIIPITVRGTVISDDVVRSTTAFLLLFVLLVVLGTAGLALGGHDLITAASASLASLSNIGPGLGDVGPVRNFGVFGSWEKLGLILLMWLGRLEILAIAALLTPSFWRR